MSDSRTKTGKPDRIRINVHQAHERAYWTKRLGVTHFRLRIAVAQAGPMVKNVKAWLIAKIRKA